MINSREIIIKDLLNSKRIKQENKVTILFDQSYHLYLDKTQSDAYIDMISADNFSSSLHDPALRLIERYKIDLLKDFRGPLSFYDLGPGLPTKTIPLLKELKKNNIRFKYFPVDISKNFLNIAETEINKIGVKSNSINCLFEDLPKFIKYDYNQEKLFFIGLTFNNYRPDDILYLLKKLSGKTGTCLIITEYFQEKNLDKILFPYKDSYAENFNYLSLNLAGIIKKDVRYFAVFRNQRIEMGFQILNRIKINDYIIEPNTEIVTAISYRYSKASLLNYISKYFPIYDVYEHVERDISLVAFRLSN